MLVDVIELVLKSEGEICHGSHMFVMDLIRCLICQTLTKKYDDHCEKCEKAADAIWILTRSCHVGGSCRFDFFNAIKSLFLQDFVKISNDLVQQPQALDTLVISFKLHVKFTKVGDGSEDDAYAGALLVVQVLKTKSKLMLGEYVAMSGMQTL